MHFWALLARFNSPFQGLQRHAAPATREPPTRQGVILGVLNPTPDASLP